MTTIGFAVHVTTDRSAVCAGLATIPSTLCRGPFQRDGWIAAWLAAHPDVPLALVTVVDAATGAPRMVLPLALDSRAGVPCWTGLDRGVSDYNAPLVAPEFDPTPSEMQTLWRQIGRALPGADLLVLEKIPDRIGDRPNPLIGLSGLHASPFGRHVLRLDGGPATIEAGFTASFAHSLARKRRKLANRGVLAFVVEHGPAALPGFDRLMERHAHRYATPAATVALYRRLFACGGVGRLGELRLDGAAIAGCFGMVDEHSFLLLALGHDEAFKNWSPGLLAIHDMIAWAGDCRLGEFDFTIGAEPYKYDFGVVRQPLWEVQTPLRLRGRAVLGVIRARAAIAGAKRWLLRPAPAEAGRVGP